MDHWILIGRNHIRPFRGNAWKSLGKSLKLKIKQLEPTKALIEKGDRSQIKRKIEAYNKKYQTDFFME